MFVHLQLRVTFPVVLNGSLQVSKANQCLISLIIKVLVIYNSALKLPKSVEICILSSKPSFLQK